MGTARNIFVQNGEFDANLDPDLAMDLLYGPIYYQLLVGHLPLDEKFVMTAGFGLSRLALLERALRCFMA